MAIRRPLVVITGEVQELPLADNLPDDSQLLSRTFTSTVLPGEPVYVDGAGSVDQAQADALGTSDVLGIAPAAVTAAQPGNVVTDGVVTLTTGEWDAVAGTTGGLSPGAKYFLDPAVAGRVEEGSSAAATEYVVEIGEGLSTTEMHVRPRRRILKVSA